MLPVEMIVQRRVAYCIQEWWSNVKFKKRMAALHKIAAHARRINSSVLYLEQTIYNNIVNVVAQAHSNFRFKEQKIMFDFNPTTFGIHMRVDEQKNIFGIQRYGNLSVPKWFGVNLTTPGFSATPYINHL